MRNRYKRRWRYFDEGLIAISSEAALFLKEFYGNQVQDGRLPEHFEMIDLQRYKKTADVRKVRAAMYEKTKEPFVFFPCKN
ncbi:MAG: hypothetical protein QM743_11225 [Chitinophagaceae bacterium]|uniref:Uncharacterized protein n=1 Tax=Rurimicrobium arvi TaxID=2049916 RepID=A0ABP8ML14_9BACT